MNRMEDSEQKKVGKVENLENILDAKSQLHGINALTFFIL